MQATPPDADSLPPPMAAIWRTPILVASAAMACTNVAGAIFALRASPEPLWGWFGFEFVMLVASVFGVLLGLGKFREGPGIAAACIAGAWFVGTGMGRIQAFPAPSQVLTDPWFLARLGGAAIVAGAGAATVLSRNPGSFRKVAAGGAMLVVVLAGAAFWMKTGGLWLGTQQDGAIDVLRKAILSTLVIGAGVLFCIGGHLVIAAFQMGVPAGQSGAQDTRR